MAMDCLSSGSNYRTVESLQTLLMLWVDTGLSLKACANSLSLQYDG